MASPKSNYSALFKMLIFSLFLYMLCANSFVSAADENKKETQKVKKPILFSEKKTDAKNSKLTSNKATSPPNGNDTLKFEDDLIWENKTFWEEFNNNTSFQDTDGEHYDRTFVDDKVEDYRYFITTTISDPKKAMDLWVDLDTLPKHQTFTHEVLSDSHRRAASINLPFKFPFYGQPVSRATIATGGFLYMGEHVHSWLAATQYIAPLMANFDTRNSTESSVLYGYNSSLFVIEWRNVKLQEQPNATFTFQCVLHINGDIAFVYKDVPILIKNIPDSGHPVKIGVSDAYFISRSAVYVRRKTIYEYHKLDMINSTSEIIKNKTAIYLQAKPTCSTLHTCNACTSQKIGFDCVWCSLAEKCSDGYDRSRQDWVSKNCDSVTNIINKTSECPAPKTPSPQNTTEMQPTLSPSSSVHSSTTVQPIIISTESSDKNIDLHGNNLTHTEYNTQERRTGNGPNKKAASNGSSVALSLFFLLSIIVGLSCWVFYAYRNPTSSSGQLLIRWRPSVWRWNSAETRYTAASIHM